VRSSTHVLGISVVPSQVKVFSARPPSTHNAAHENVVSTRGMKRQRHGGDCLCRAYTQYGRRGHMHLERSSQTSLHALTQQRQPLQRLQRAWVVAKQKTSLNATMASETTAMRMRSACKLTTSHHIDRVRALPCVTCMCLILLKTQRSFVATDRRQHSTRQRATIKMMQFASLFSVSARQCTQCHLTATLATRAHRALTDAPKRRSAETAA
jgi:hypothetical protein